MNEEEQHEAYKQLLARLLTTFFLDVTSEQHKEEFNTLGDAKRYIEWWIEQHIKPPHMDYRVENHE